eukprot:Clim_evm2s46 gene=Clim_evmTU2s46
MLGLRLSRMHLRPSKSQQILPILCITTARIGHRFLSTQVRSPAENTSPGTEDSFSTKSMSMKDLESCFTARYRPEAEDQEACFYYDRFPDQTSVTLRLKKITARKFIPPGPQQLQKRLKDDYGLAVNSYIAAAHLNACRTAGMHPNLLRRVLFFWRSLHLKLTSGMLVPVLDRAAEYFRLTTLSGMRQRRQGRKLGGRDREYVGNSDGDNDKHALPYPRAVNPPTKEQWTTWVHATVRKYMEEAMEEQEQRRVTALAATDEENDVTAVGNLAMKFYTSVGDFDTAMEMFDFMREQGIELDSFSLAEAIRALNYRNHSDFPAVMKAMPHDILSALTVSPQVIGSLLTVLNRDHRLDREQKAAYARNVEALRQRFEVETTDVLLTLLTPTLGYDYCVALYDDAGLRMSPGFFSAWAKDARASLDDESARQLLRRMSLSLDEQSNNSHDEITNTAQKAETATDKRRRIIARKRKKEALLRRHELPFPDTFDELVCLCAELRDPKLATEIAREYVAVLELSVAHRRNRSGPQHGRNAETNSMLLSLTEGTDMHSKLEYALREYRVPF